MNSRTRTKVQVKLEVTEPLHVKYRPTSLGDVVGQDHVIKSIRKMMADKARPHAFAFTGGSGTGKTTLARILAAEFGVAADNLVEIDGAASGGIDTMREIMAPLQYFGFGSPNKAVIVDEAHQLSKAAWASLLKSVEEPPDHVFWFFCTTEASKIPDNIMTRCVAYNLKQVGRDSLLDLLESVCDREGLDCPATTLSAVADACGGSPRRALVQLAMVHSCNDPDEVATLLEAPIDNKEVIDLARGLINGNINWDKCVAILRQLGDMPAESIRIILVNFFNACAMNAKSEKAAIRALDLIESFSKPCNPSDKLAPILIACGRYIYP